MRPSSVTVVRHPAFTLVSAVCVYGGRRCPTLKALEDTNHQVVITAARPPSQNTSTFFTLHPPTYFAAQNESPKKSSAVPNTEQVYAIHATAHTNTVPVPQQTSRCEETSRDEPASPPPPCSRGTSRPWTPASTRRWYPKTRAPPRRSRSACRALPRRRGRRCAFPTIGPPPCQCQCQCQCQRQPRFCILKGR